MLYCTLTGGEAMCHKDFFKIAREVTRKGMALRIYSNGYLLADKKMVRRIKELHPTEVEISIHGARAESHEGLTKIRGSFAKTVKALENLVEAGIRVNLKCPITRLNQDELFEIKALAERLGLSVIFDAVITLGDTRTEEELRLMTATTAGEVMSAPATTITPETTMAQIATMMGEQHVHTLPVVDDNGAIIGVVGKRDLIKAMAR